MACNHFILLLFLALALTLPSITFAFTASVVDVSSLNRTSFPTGFVFGTASAAYQVHRFRFRFCIITFKICSNINYGQI